MILTDDQSVSGLNRIAQPGRLDFMRTESISIKTNREFYPAGCSGGLESKHRLLVHESPHFETGYHHPNSACNPPSRHNHFLHPQIKSDNIISRRNIKGHKTPLYTWLRYSRNMSILPKLSSLIDLGRLVGKMLMNR